MTVHSIFQIFDRARTWEDEPNAVIILVTCCRHHRHHRCCQSLAPTLIALVTFAVTHCRCRRGRRAAPRRGWRGAAPPKPPPLPQDRWGRDPEGGGRLPRPRSRPPPPLLPPHLRPCRGRHNRHGAVHILPSCCPSAFANPSCLNHTPYRCLTECRQRRQKWRHGGRWWSSAAAVVAAAQVDAPTRVNAIPATPPPPSTRQR